MSSLAAGGDYAWVAPLTAICKICKLKDVQILNKMHEFMTFLLHILKDKSAWNDLHNNP